MCVLVREPHNVYDRNAIRVDNLAGRKVGHVKASRGPAFALAQLWTILIVLFMHMLLEMHSFTI